MHTWTPRQLAARLQDTSKPLAILDVRESWEYEIAHFNGSTLIPLGQLAQRMLELDRAQEWLVVCHHGVRSAHACYYLAQHGFTVINLLGGIDRWAREVDLQMPLY
ncbi:MAG: rhodanese-like domain-containing protein [Thiothrix sp.]